MNRFPLSHVFGGAQPIDFHITKIRQQAEERFADLFTQAMSFRCELNDSAFSDDEYDARVVGLTTAILTRVHPLNGYLRYVTAGLVSLETANRKEMVVLPETEVHAAVNSRSDLFCVTFVVDALAECLYPKGSYLGGLQPGLTGLEGLSISLRRDVIGEADAHGIISLRSLRRINENLSHAVACAPRAGDELILSRDGTPLSAGEYNRLATINQRGTALVDLIALALDLESTIECVPSYFREQRICAPVSEPARRAS